MVRTIFQWIGITSLLALISCGPLQIQTDTLKNGYIGKDYSVTLDLTGAVGTVTWTLDGILPGGLQFDPSTREIHGVPSQKGNFDISFTATDSAPTPRTTTKNFTLVIEDLSIFYVAPTAKGLGSGSTPSDAASYRSGSFWNMVQDELEICPVKVLFLNGDYSKNLTLQKKGNEEHHLTLQGETDLGMRFNPLASAPVKKTVVLAGCQNMTIKDFNFRGHITEYGMTITKSGSVKSHDITVDSCTWIDLPTVYYGGMGAHYGSYNITIQNNVFKRLGKDSHAHMIYNAYSIHHISVVNNHFEDCSGAHVRFRANADHCTASGNTFVQTGNYENQHQRYTAFLQVPLFNDVNPGDETFGTHYDFSDNDFEFSSSVPGDTMAISFYHKGFNPPGMNYLLTPSQGKVLQEGSPYAVKNLLMTHYGIDTDEVKIYGNRYVNTDIRVDFATSSGYGSPDTGFNGHAEIYPAIASRGVFETDFENDDLNKKPEDFYVMEYDLPGTKDTHSRVKDTSSIGMCPGPAGTRAVRLFDNSKSKNTYIRYDLPSMKAGYFSAWVYLNSGSSNKYVMYAKEKGGKASYLVNARSNGEWGNGNGNFTWWFSNPNHSLGRWYRVEVVFDVREGKYSVWINQDRVVKDKSIPNNPKKGWDYFYMNPAPVSGWGSMYVDDVKIRDLTEDVSK